MICSAVVHCSVSIKDVKKTFIDSKGCKSKYLVENPNRKEYFSIDFENGVYENRENDTKCDYGVQTDTNIFYIELKGSDVKKGIEQLLLTIRETKKCFNGLEPKARLIVSKFPKPESVRNTKEYKDLAKLLNFQYLVNDNLEIKQNTFTEKI
jgi:hypothetical protein